MIQSPQKFFLNKQQNKIENNDNDYICKTDNTESLIQ